MSRIRLPIVGSAVRITLSTHPVHSCSWIQITLGRFIVCSALAIFGTAPLVSPSTTQSPPQNSRKSRRDTPRSSRWRPRGSPSVHGCELGENTGYPPTFESHQRFNCHALRKHTDHLRNPCLSTIRRAPQAER